MHVIPLPAFSLSSNGLILLASRELRWIVNLPATTILTYILHNRRKPLLHEVPTFTRSNANILTHAKDP